MTACIRIPASLSDAEAIVSCYGGADWRTLFLYGLAGVVVIGVLVLLAWLAVRGTAA